MSKNNFPVQKISQTLKSNYFMETNNIIIQNRWVGNRISHLKMSELSQNQELIIDAFEVMRFNQLTLDDM